MNNQMRASLESLAWLHLTLGHEYGALVRYFHVKGLEERRVECSAFQDRHMTAFYSLTASDEKLRQKLVADLAEYHATMVAVFEAGKK